MDLLYQKYSNPMDLMGRYINQGRFGEFVHEFLTLENERRKEEFELEQRRELWAAYIRILPEETFEDWKARVTKPSSTKNKGSDMNMTQQGAQAIIDSLFS